MSRFQCFLATLLLGAAAGMASETNLLVNGSFEEGRGTPLHWQGAPSALIRLAPAAGAPGQVLQLKQGGSVSQTAPAEAGRSYQAMVRANTTSTAEYAKSIEYATSTRGTTSTEYATSTRGATSTNEPEVLRYVSGAYISLTFLPSGKKIVTQMVSPFGNRDEFVPHAVGGTAPPGTKGVRVTIYAATSPCTVDDVQLIAYRDSATAFRLKDMHITTPIVVGGRAAATIVAPASGIHDEACRAIAAAIRERTGVNLPIVKDTSLDLCRNQRLASNLIVPGNRSTSRTVSDLYDLYYCIVDLRYPGKGGSVVRSLHDPFGDGHNVIFVGASDAEGMRKATDAFIRALGKAKTGAGDLALGHLAQIELGSDMKIPATTSVSSLLSVPPWGSYGWNLLTKTLACYYLTGSEFYAHEFMRLAFAKDKQTRADLASDGAFFFMNKEENEPLIDVYHYRAHLPVVYWDLVEESPVFSDDDRARVTRQFIKQLKTYRTNGDYGCGIDETLSPAVSLRDRHGQWAAMTFYTLARYLSKYYPDHEWWAVKRAAENSFAPLYMKRFFTNVAERDKLERYPSTLAALFAYTLMAGKKAPVTVGSLQEQTRARMDMLTDCQDDAWVLRQATPILFNQIAYVLGNSLYTRLRDLCHQLDNDRFRLGQSFWPDERALPFKPLPTNQWEILRMTQGECDSLLYDGHVPPETRNRIFRLGSYRTSSDAKGDFLLFEGAHVGGLYKCFAMVEHVLNGNILLMGARTQPEIMSDGMMAEQQPRYSLLDRTEANGASALIAARVPGYNSTDWERAVLHRQGQYTLIVDKLTGLENNASSTITFNWSLAHGAKVSSIAPGCAVLQVDGSGLQEPLYTFNALSSTGIQFKTSTKAGGIRTSGNAVVLRSSNKDVDLEIAFETERDIDSYMVVEIPGGPEFGTFKLKLDNAVLADAISGYDPRNTSEAAVVSLGRRKIKAGRHVFRLEGIGFAPGRLGDFRMGLRGFKMFAQPGRTSYLLGMSSKLKTKATLVGTTIGSTESGEPICASWYGPMEKGREMLFFTLIAPQAGHADTNSGNCIALAPNAAALDLREGCAIAACGKYADISANVAVLGSGHLTAYAATSCGGFAASDHPVDIDWDFAGGTLALNAARRSTVTLALQGARVNIVGRGAVTLYGADKGYALVVEPGRQVITGAVPNGSLLDHYRTRLASVFIEAKAARRLVPAVESPTPVVSTVKLKPAWQAQAGDFPFDLQTLQADGKTLVVAAAGKNVLVFDSAGTLVSKLKADDLVKTVHYWPEAGVLAAGCHDFKVIAFDLATGARRWVFKSPDSLGESSGWGRTYPRNRGIHALASGVFLDGRSQLLVGTANMVEAVDESGKLRHTMDAGPGSVTDIALLDRGNDEILMFPAQLLGSSRINRTSSRNPDKVLRFSVGPFTPRPGATHVGNIGNGYTAIEAVDLDGDGRKELVGLFNGMLNGIHVWDSKGTDIAAASFGPGSGSPFSTYQKSLILPNMRGLSIADINGDGRKELCVITSRGFLIVLNDKCAKLWARILPSEPVTLQAFDAAKGGKGAVAVGCRDGRVYTLDAAGVFIAQAELGAIPARMTRLDETRLVVADVKGALTALQVR